MKVTVFTTSYPRGPDDFAGRFVSGLVERVRERGVDVDVVAPGDYSTYGLSSDGGGIVRAAKRRPWAAPPMLASMARTLRAAARDADLVHAHWLAGGAVALLAGKPFVVTLHGTISGGALDDFELLRKASRPARLVLDRARAVICVSEALTEAALAAGVTRAVFIPNGIDVPPEVGEEAEPPEILYAGRLAPEKGIEDLAAVADGLNLVVSGDGPLRGLLPQASGFLPRDELERRYAQAAIVVCPSRSEGFGVVCAEAMANGKPVVAGAVGGLVNLVDDERTGLLVPPGDPPALRAAIDRLLADKALRLRLGAAGREKIVAGYSWDKVAEETVAVYEQALSTAPPRKRLAFRRPPASYDDEFMDVMADAYERKTAWTRLRLAAVEDLVEPHEGDRVLDLGCAAGAVTHFLSTFGCEPVGVDAEPVAIEHARKRFPDLRFEVADVRDLPFADGSFDKAVAADLVEHLDDPTLAGMLAEARRVLVPGGTLSVYTPNPKHLIERLKARELLLAQNPTHIGLRTAPELVQAFERAGFAVDRDEWRASHFPVLRTVERSLGGGTDFLRYRLCLRARNS
ncbi:MAG TPA: glycosyltransferase [Gaiellaceae bacterium]